MSDATPDHRPTWNRPPGNRRATGPAGRRAARLLAAAAIPLVALALLVSGAVLAATGQAESFGWFAYAPLEESTGPGSLMMLTGKMQLGYLLVALGLVAAAFWGGFRLGRRAAPASSSQAAGRRR